MPKKKMGGKKAIAEAVRDMPHSLMDDGVGKHKANAMKRDVVSITFCKVSLNFKITYQPYC
jgi:hypothetical protein